MSASGGRLWAHGSYFGIRTGQPVAWRAGPGWRRLAVQPSGNDIVSADKLAADGLGNLWVRGEEPGPLPRSMVLHWDGAHWARRHDRRNGG